MKARTFRSCAFVLALVLVAATVAMAAPQTEAAAGGADRLAAVGFNATGYPIVDTRITVNALIQRPGTYGPFDEMSALNELEELTNIDIVYEEVPSAQLSEKTNLMFASREFPDVTFNFAVSDTNLWGAAQGGDVYALNPLIEQYSPNWQRAFEERPVIRAGNSHPDGNIYSLPYYREILNDFGIRDTMAINVDWLQRVGKEMPATTDEFFDVMMAFRQGIDNGTLPENGIPWVIRFGNWSNGGEWEIYNAFGLWMKGQGTNAEKYLSVNDGVVEFGATDPKLKDAAAYLNRLYENRILVEESFTDGSSEFVAKSRSVPPISGYRGEYFIVQAVEEFFDPLPPLQGPTGVRRYRSQPVRMEKNKFVIYTGFDYPEAMVRYMDHLADDTWSVNLSYGGPLIQDNPDGTRTINGRGQEWNHIGPHNMFASYISKRASDQLIWLGEQGNREQYVREVFGPHTWPQDRHYAYVTYTDEEIEELSIMSADIHSHIQTTMAGWIVNGGIDEGWNGYLAELDRLGLDRAMEIFQTAYDRFWGN